MNKEKAFEVRVVGSTIIVGLGGSRLFQVNRGGGSYSEDGGRTWSESFELKQKGQEDLLTPIRGDLLLSIHRLASGKLGGIEFVFETSTDPHHMLYVTSDDEGRTWSKGVRIDELQWGVNSLIELSSGRLLVPVYRGIADYDHPEYQDGGIDHPHRGGYGTYQGRRMLVEGHGHTPEFGYVKVFYSDDQGQTWQSGPNNLYVWPLPSEENFGGYSALTEPVEVELKDGRILMFFRTIMGRLYQSLSTDGGVHWSIPEPTELASSESPCMVRNIPGTEDLLIIWNQVSAEEILRGLKRCRMCCAISTDQGKTWKNFKTLETCGGLPCVGKIDPPPIRTYHSYDDVGEIPVDMGNFGYPEIAFVEDMVLFSYSVHETLPVSEWTDKTAIYGEEDSYGRIKAMPVSRLYE